MKAQRNRDGVGSSNVREWSKGRFVPREGNEASWKGLQWNVG